MATAKADRASFATSHNKRSHDQTLAENMATSARVTRGAPYERIIREILAETGHLGQYDPRHIEAYMRVQYGTLDHLTREQFRDDMAIARECVDLDGVRNAEDAAISYGM